MSDDKKARVNELVKQLFDQAASDVEVPVAGHLKLGERELHLISMALDATCEIGIAAIAEETKSLREADDDADKRLDKEKVRRLVTIAKDIRDMAAIRKQIETLIEQGNDMVKDKKQQRGDS